MGVVLYAPALALEAITGISQTNAILMVGECIDCSWLRASQAKRRNMIWSNSSTGVVCTFYSTIGGMKAVLITDVFQSILMFAAIYCVIIVVMIKAGGIGPIIDAAQKGGRMNLLQ